MPRKPSKQTQRDESRMEATALLMKADEKILKIIELKNQELKLDHENDFKSQLVLDLIRKIKVESSQEKISAYAGIAESQLVAQIEADQKDDVPHIEARNLITSMGSEINKAIEWVRKI